MRIYCVVLKSLFTKKVKEWKYSFPIDMENRMYYIKQCQALCKCTCEIFYTKMIC